MLEALTVLALVVGLIDGIMTLALLHRQHDDEVSDDKMWELQTALDRLLVNTDETLKHVKPSEEDPA